MNVLEAIKARRSVRAYKSDPVPEDVLHRVLEAGRLAPSAWNSQPWRFIVVKDPDIRADIAQGCPSKTRVQTFIGEAPVVIVAVAVDTERVMSSGLISWPIDMAIAIDHMTLAAADEGLGTCWIGSFEPETLKRLLDIPEKAQITAVIPLGYPADEPKKKVRKDLEEIVSWESF